MKNLKISKVDRRRGNNEVRRITIEGMRENGETVSRVINFDEIQISKDFGTALSIIKAIHDMEKNG